MGTMQWRRGRFELTLDGLYSRIKINQDQLSIPVKTAEAHSTDALVFSGLDHTIVWRNRAGVVSLRGGSSTTGDRPDDGRTPHPRLMTA